MDDQAPLSFGLWIKRRRKALDMTQDALAALVGCSKNLIVKIEGDARRPSREIAALRATNLQLAPEERADFVRCARAELLLVATTIAQTLGVIDAGSLPIRDRLTSALRTKELLLLLDNFEQVLDAAPLVAKLLAAAVGLKVLITSRCELADGASDHVAASGQISVSAVRSGLACLTEFSIPKPVFHVS